MPRDGRVAVVMITHNRVDEVLRSLHHLTELPEQPPILVVDNASTDGTDRAVAERFPQVEVLKLDQNSGAVGRNQGVRRVAEPYVAFCDDDTWWEPGSLRHAADLFDAHPRLAIITGKILIGPSEREDPICQVLEASPLPRDPGLPGSPLLGFMAGASVVRRSAFLEVGGFPERYMVGGEEEPVGLDLAMRGWLMRYVPELVVHHYPSERRNGTARRWIQGRNAIWSAWLRRPVSGALGRTGELIVKAARDRVLFQTLGATLAGLPWVLRERRVVPLEIEHQIRLLEAQRNPKRRPQPGSDRPRSAPALSSNPEASAG